VWLDCPERRSSFRVIYLLSMKTATLAITVPSPRLPLVILPRMQCVQRRLRGLERVKMRAGVLYQLEKG
jgi:hypothetical protein